MSSSCPAVLRVILQDHDVRKLSLSSGIPDTVDDLLTIVKERFQLAGQFTLMYMDEEFGNFFTFTSTSDIKNKDSIKIVTVEEPSVVLTLTPVCDSEISLPPEDLDQQSTDDHASTSSRDTVLLTPSEDRSEKWPDKFQIPEFSFHVDRVLQAGNQAYFENGTLLQSHSVKSDILEKLAESIFKYTAYPTNLQILSVTEALIEKYPCLKEPGSFSGMYGWQQSLKYKMGNFRAKLRNKELAYPELEVNSLKRKQPNERVPSKNVKKPKKAELNYLPPHPNGESLESLEHERQTLLNEIKKKDNQRVIAEKMSKTFSYRRHEVVNLSPPIKDFQEKWPALFTEVQIKEEFRRITAVSLEQTFMAKLDSYTPKLLELMNGRGGVKGVKIKQRLSALTQGHNIEKRRDAVIRSLIEYLGEVGEDLFKDCNDDYQEDINEDVMTILCIRDGNANEHTVSIVLEGRKVLTKCENPSKACALLMGLIYALNLQYPVQLKYTFEVFQKLFLELDGLKLSPKVRSLKNKLLT